MEHTPHRGVRPLIVATAAAGAVLLAAPLALSHTTPSRPRLTGTSSAQERPALFRGVTPTIAALHQLPPSWQSRGSLGG